MSTPCHISFVLTVECGLSLVEPILAEGLEALDFLHYQCLEIQIIHVLDSVYLQSESAIPA